MPITKTVTGYTLAELKELHPKGYDKALEKLREWATEDGSWYELTIKCWKEYLEYRCGFSKVEINFRGFWSQGDGACFYGQCNDILKFMQGFSDEEHPIFNLSLTSQYPTLFAALQEGNEVLEDISFTLYKNSHHYSHQNTISLDWDSGPTLLSLSDTKERGYLTDDEYDKVKDAVRELDILVADNIIGELRGVMREMYKHLEELHEDASSEESLTDMAQANEYYFYADGKPF